MPECIQCKSSFALTENERTFLQKEDLPEPLKCPECRLVRRLQERNARKLYYRKCDFSGRRIISTYHSGHTFPVYDQEIWWSDKWEALDYGRDFDFSRPFFPQLKELEDAVPHFSVFIVGGTLENSEFTNCTGYLKNCYLISEADYDEDCLYANRIYHSKNIIDCTNIYDSELCYECVDCRNCYRLLYSEECEQCHESYFLKNCIGLSDCIGCINLRHKRNMIFNKQYSSEEYEKLKKMYALNTYAGVKAFKKKVDEFFMNEPQKALEGEHNEIVFGDHVYDSKNAYYCFDCKDLEDCDYVVKTAVGVKNCIDYTSWGFKAELMYQAVACGDNAYNVKFSSNCTSDISNLDYCFQCSRSQDLFACAGLKSKKYCIFNKQYSKDEYVALRDRIIEHMRKTGEWGQFPPIDLCPFGYNETIAMDQFPLTKEEALAQGFKWSDYEMELPKVDKIIGAETLPESITEVTDDLLQHAIACEITKRPFKLTETELAFYRTLDIPCPRRRPDQRHADRQGKRPSYRLNKSFCSQCNAAIITNVLRDEPKKRLCADCYAKIIY